MAAGRPRTVSFPPEEMEALGIEMVEWVKLNNPIHLSQWYCIEKMFTEKQWETFQHKEEFVPYYEQALKLIGFQYLKKDSQVEPNVKNRWQRSYFRDLKKLEDQDLDDAATRAAKAAEGDKVDPQLVEQFKAFMSLVKDSQTKPST